MVGHEECGRIDCLAPLFELSHLFHCSHGSTIFFWSFEFLSKYSSERIIHWRLNWTISRQNHENLQWRYSSCLETIPWHASLLIFLHFRSWFFSVSAFVKNIQLIKTQNSNLLPLREVATWNCLSQNKCHLKIQHAAHQVMNYDTSDADNLNVMCQICILSKKNVFPK